MPGRQAETGPATQPAAEDLPVVVVETYRFCCQACGHEFWMREDDLPDYWHEFRPIDPHRLDCPKCGAKRSCHAMTKCPKCSKWFVAPETSDVLICPHCGTDIVEFIRGHAPN